MITLYFLANSVLFLCDICLPIICLFSTIMQSKASIHHQANMTERALEMLHDFHMLNSCY